MADRRDLPKLPYLGFPLRPHRNGHWYKSVWNPRAKKTEQFYFGSWKDDPRGKRAMSDPEHGWLARQDRIKAGIDQPGIAVTGSDITLGELMSRFLCHKRSKAHNGELSLATLADYLREVQAFVGFMRPSMPPGGLRPEHFTAYMNHLVDSRKLGRASRRRVRAYVTAFLRFGDKNGWYDMPKTGVDWIAPATDPDSMRQARARAGQRDFSDRILSGDEVDRLVQKTQPSMRAMILLGVNCGLGPADIGRLRWEMIDLESGALRFPRPKTGALRVGYLWTRTRAALRRVQNLKHNKVALLAHGRASLVFLTRKNRPYYREREVHEIVNVDGKGVKKLVSVRCENSISLTFGRLARALELEGVTFYRLRHTFRTLAKSANDREAIDLMMGHKDSSIGKSYDHEEVDFFRIRRVAVSVKHRLWERTKRSGDKKVSHAAPSRELARERQ